jgi:hypothetical protein
MALLQESKSKSEQSFKSDTALCSKTMKSTISFGHRQSGVPGGLNVTRSLGDLDAHLECGIASFPEVQLGQQRAICGIKLQQQMSTMGNNR